MEFRPRQGLAGQALDGETVFVGGQVPVGAARVAVVPLSLGPPAGRDGKLATLAVVVHIPPHRTIC